MLDQLEGCWRKGSHFWLWDWIAFVHGVLWVIVLMVAVMVSGAAAAEG